MSDPIARWERLSQFDRDAAISTLRLTAAQSAHDMAIALSEGLAEQGCPYKVEVWINFVPLDHPMIAAKAEIGPP